MPEEQFPVLDVSDWEIIADETAGAEEKYWLLEPGTGSLWLFKSVTVKQGHVHGEDWAEKASAQLAVLLGVPCARIELAELRGALGCVGADLRPALHELQHGQLLLEARDAPGYIHGKGKKHLGHSVENIHAALAGILPPPGCEPGFDATAYDVFAGYLLFDAWVANRTPAVPSQLSWKWRQKRFGLPRQRPSGTGQSGSARLTRMRWYVFWRA